MDLDALKKLRGSKKSIKDIQEAISKQNGSGQKSKEKDTRFWSVERDEAGNGSAVIRFLPKHENDDLEWVRIFKHSFKGPTNKWYIENSLTTLGKPDPVGDKNTELWNSGLESNKDIARKQKRKLSYICNVLVIKDPAHPENEGQVKLFTFGKKIFDMIADKVDPKFSDDEDDEPIDVFDIDNGCNFKLRIHDKDGYANYDKSSFSSPSPLCGGDDDEILKVLNKLHFLGEFVAPEQFKTYEQLKARFDEVMNGKGNAKTAEADAQPDVAPKAAPEIKETPKKELKETKAAKPASTDDDDDDDMAFFSKHKKRVEDDEPF